MLSIFVLSFINILKNERIYIRQNIKSIFPIRIFKKKGEIIDSQFRIETQIKILSRNLTFIEKSVIHQ